MIVKTEKRLCDVCGAEMREYSCNGSLKLEYTGRDYMGNGFPVKIIRHDICDKCTKSLVSIVESFLKEAKGCKNEQRYNTSSSV